MRNTFAAFLMVVAILQIISTPHAAASPVIVDRVVAVVNDEVITLSDLQRETTLKGNLKSDERLILADMIDRKLQMEAARHEGLEVTDQELSDAVNDIMKRNNLTSTQFSDALAREGLTVPQYKSELREQMTLSRLVNKHVRSVVAVDEADVRAFYERNKNAYTLPEEVRVRRIYLRIPKNATAAQTEEIRKKADALYEEARKGDAQEFIGLVRKNSEGVTANQDGDLGFMQRDQVIPAIAEAIQGLKPGDVTAPFPGAGGFNIIRLEETRKPVRPYEKVKDEIMKTLYDQKVENTYRSWLQSLRENAQIENKL